MMRERWKIGDGNVFEFDTSILYLNIITGEGVKLILHTHHTLHVQHAVSWEILALAVEA